MTMIEAVQSVFSQYATFSGRARRAEYWWFKLFLIIAGVVLGIADGAFFGTGNAETAVDAASVSVSASLGPLLTIFLLVVLLPSIALNVRRLHDTRRSGWWLLIGFVPLIGQVVLLWFYASSGTVGLNRYGRDPIS